MVCVGPGQKLRLLVFLCEGSHTRVTVIQEVIQTRVIYFAIAIFQDSLHQSIDALSIFPDPITIFADSHSNPRCLATREYKIRPWPRLKLILLL